MYCSNCGAKAAGNFCSRCGARLASSQEPPPLPQDWQDERGAQPPVPSHDWKDEIRYDVLLHFPKVRDLIARHAAQAREGTSAEDFLKFCDKALAPLMDVSLSTVVSIALPIYTRIGIKTGKTRKEVLPGRAGKILVAALCSLARYGRQLKQVHQGEDGCVLEAVLPSDMWSSQGELVVSIRRQRTETHVEAATKIPGQLFDWGKSKQCLNQLFEDLESLLD